MSDEVKQPAKQKKAIDTLVVIFAVVIVACLLTWVVPAGEFVRVKDAASGKDIIDPASFHWIDRSPVNPILIPMHVMNGARASVDLIFLLICSGAAFAVILKTGAMHSSIGAIALKYRDKKEKFVLALFILFCFIMLTQSVDRFMAFVPVLVLISLALGLDSITGVAILVGGSACGFATGCFNTATTLIAQEMAGLPPFSGLWYRAICFFSYMLLTGFMLWRYVRKITKDPTASPTYELDKSQNLGDPSVIKEYGPMNLRKWLVVLTLVVGLCVMINGTLRMKWSFKQLGATFIWIAVISGFCGGLSASGISKTFVEGAKRMMMVVLVVAIARAISTILSDGKILDTIVYGLSNVLRGVPKFLQAPAMFVVNLLVNVVIPSGSGQAAAVMPIMLPLADIIGMSRQTAILAFNFGDGFCNWITPTGSALIGVLGMVQVPFDKWLKFIIPIFCGWFVLGCVLVSIAHIIQLA